MTRATNDLREEHRWIRQLLECLDEIVGAFRSSGDFDSKAAVDLQSLFEHFVDEQHQEKEEIALFPKLLECVKKLQEEHAEEREHLDRMRFSLFNAILGDPASRTDFVDEAQEYLDLQRKHMAREDAGVLPLADGLLTTEDDDEVIAEFRRMEARGLERDEIRGRVRELCGRLSVPFEEEHVG